MPRFQPDSLPLCRRSATLLVATCLALTGCFGDGDASLDAGPGGPLGTGLAALQDGDHEAAAAEFQRLLEAGADECEAHYGMALATIQNVADRIDTIADAAAVFLGAAPGARPAQADVYALVEGALVPFEDDFDTILVELGHAIDGGCSIALPRGYPLEAGEPDSLIYVRMVLGYEFDEAAARLIRAIYASLQSGIRYLLAHDLELSTSELTETLETVTDAFFHESHIHVHGNRVTIPTILPALRAVGVVPGNHPDLLRLKDAERMAMVDDDLETLFRSLYDEAGGPAGLLPAAAAAAVAGGAPPEDRMFGLIDADGNGRTNAGDTLVIGIRELHATGLLSIPSVADAIHVHLSPAVGDVDAVVGAAHDVFQTLGDQMAAVDDPSVDAERLGLGPVNRVIDAIALVDLLIEPLPEALEFDLTAYFANPVGVRDLLPMWIDHDDDAETPDHLLLEGEAWVTSPTHPYVTFGDTQHFTGSYSFDPGAGSSASQLDDITLPADGVEPPDEAVLLSTPLVYSAFQDPSFNGVLYVDLSKLATAPEGSAGFAVADLYAANKAVVDYTRFVIDAWLHP